MIKGVAAAVVAAAGLVGSGEAACSSPESLTTCSTCIAVTDCTWCGAQYKEASETEVSLNVGVCADTTCPNELTAFPLLAPLYTATDLAFSLTALTALTDCTDFVESDPTAMTTEDCDASLQFCYGYLTNMSDAAVAEGGICSAEQTCATALPNPDATKYNIAVGENTTTTVAPAACSTHATCSVCAADVNCEWCQPELSYVVNGGTPAETLIKNYGGCYDTGACATTTFASIEALFDVPSGTNAAGDAAEMGAATVAVPAGGKCLPEISYSEYDTSATCEAAGFTWCNVSVWIGAEDGPADNTGSLCANDCSALAAAYPQDPTLLLTDDASSTIAPSTEEAVHACTSTHATCSACAADAGCDWCQPQLSYAVANGSPSETLIKNYGGCYEAGTCPSVAFTSIEETFDVPSGTNAAGNAAEMGAATVAVPTGNTCTADVTYSPYETCVACKDAGFEWCRVQVWIGAEEGEVDNVGSMCHAKCSDLAGSFTEDPTVKTDSAACSDGAFTTKTASLGVAAVVAAAALFAAA